ncbi:hypothetical protein Pmani_016600 [Petrolisthes manimaculis]|uniref:Uncharacterized protein n=1 Tax=Petrolisthes manimaculis TaxID=1843537 RepID=A0AAE1PPD7_9EUCA|nr:hypothetical protein Pmani_016600 [Petrolisthes manimaculis]
MFWSNKRSLGKGDAGEQMKNDMEKDASQQMIEFENNVLPSIDNGLCFNKDTPRIGSASSNTLVALNSSESIHCDKKSARQKLLFKKDCAFFIPFCVNCQTYFIKEEKYLNHNPSCNKTMVSSINPGSLSGHIHRERVPLSNLNRLYKVGRIVGRISNYKQLWKDSDSSVVGTVKRSGKSNVNKDISSSSNNKRLSHQKKTRKSQKPLVSNDKMTVTPLAGSEKNPSVSAVVLKSPHKDDVNKSLGKVPIDKNDAIETDIVAAVEDIRKLHSETLKINGSSANKPEPTKPNNINSDTGKIRVVDSNVSKDKHKQRELIHNKDTCTQQREEIIECVISPGFSVIGSKQGYSDAISVSHECTERKDQGTLVSAVSDGHVHQGSVSFKAETRVSNIAQVREIVEKIDNLPVLIDKKRLQRRIDVKKYQKKPEQNASLERKDKNSSKKTSIEKDHEGNSFTVKKLKKGIEIKDAPPLRSSSDKHSAESAVSKNVAKSDLISDSISSRGEDLVPESYICDNDCEEENALPNVSFDIFTKPGKQEDKMKKEDPEHFLYRPMPRSKKLVKCRSLLSGSPIEQDHLQDDSESINKRNRKILRLEKIVNDCPGCSMGIDGSSMIYYEKAHEVSFRCNICRWDIVFPIKY